MKSILKPKSFLIMVSVISSMLFFSCQKDNLDDVSSENPNPEIASSKAAATVYFSIQAPDGRYLSSENGNKPVSATRTNVGAWEKFELIDIGGRRAIIKGSNGKYLTQLQTASNGTTLGTNILRCIASRENAEEFVSHNGGRYPSFAFESLTHLGINYALNSDAKKLEGPTANPTIFTLKLVEEEEPQEPINVIGSNIYVVSTTERVISSVNSFGVLSSENGTKPMSAKRSDFGGKWEILTFEEVGGRGVYIKGSNGKYLTSVDGTKPLAFVGNTINDGEKFISQSSGLFPNFFFNSLTFPNNKYKLSNDLLRLEPVTATSDATEFRLASATEATYAVKANNGKYLSSENGDKPVSATRTNVGTWEKIEFIRLPGRSAIFRGSNGKYLTSKVVNGKSVLFFIASLDKAEKFNYSFDALFPSFGFQGLISNIFHGVSSDGLRIESDANEIGVSGKNDEFTLEQAN